MKLETEMTSEQLWAKSPRSPKADRPVTLSEHISAVYTAAKCIFEEIAPFLPVELDKKALQELVYVSAVLHDIGKANSAFQDMLRGRLQHKNQPVRHEVLSALVTTGIIEETEKFSEWLCKRAFSHRPCEWVWMVAWAAGGHHLKLHHYADHERGALTCISAIDESIEFYGQSTSPTLDILDAVLLEMDITVNGRPDLPNFALSCDLSEEFNHVALVEKFVWESEEVAEQLDEGNKLLLAYAKAIVIAADVAGSALWTTEFEPAVRQSLQKTVNEAELEAIVREMRNKNSAFVALRPFQEQTAKTRSPAILIAACGGGKTVAAYEWAKQHEGQKLFFCYPTTGTASAGFADYLFAQSELERDLIHSRAEVDIEHMTKNGGERDEERESLLKVESLRAWGQQVIACTADTVLGLVQNNRRALFSFPAIIKSAIVFDEVHSYDAKLFGALIRFLWAFPQIPVLLMSASLPKSRINALREAFGERWQEPIGGDEVEEGRSRYRLEWQENKDDCWTAVSETLKNKGKILWVCNTVGDAIEVYRQAKDKVSEIAPILYHSRFRYKDRVDIQEKVIAAFKEKDRPCLAVTTQVCEMSLDISAQLMVTALPPFPSLVQRLGRLNRRGEVQKGARGLVYPFSCKDGEPYRWSELKKSNEIVKRLCTGDKALSQADLKKELDTLVKEEELKLHSSWLDGGWESRQATLREGGATITVLLEQDHEKIKEVEQCGRGKLAAWTVPILYKPQQLKTLDTIKGYPLVEGVLYSEETGAEWQDENKK